LGATIFFENWPICFSFDDGKSLRAVTPGRSRHLKSEAQARSQSLVGRKICTAIRHGNWSTEQIVTALQTGKRPDGRMLAPIMPWRAFANLTKADATAIAVFLESLPPVRNKVPGPFGPADTPTSFVMKVIAPAK